MGQQEPQALGEGPVPSSLGKEVEAHLFPECWKHPGCQSLAVTFGPHSLYSVARIERGSSQYPEWMFQPRGWGQVLGMA